ncbi:hypothetical protein WDV06_21635 [Streptomyces racemochromogenes]|uniref:Tat pathway signal sequence domain protein n=1 Tax=Streptomyces racemochromogenes TaxID=67353 RepID=A0ABW7PGZ7_9ACTN
MRRRLRVPHRTAGAALAAALLTTAPVGTAPDRTPAAAVRAHHAPSAAARAPQPLAPAADEEVPEEAYEELAGSAGGVGREHPGRPADAPADPGLTSASRPLHPVRPPPRPEREHPANQRPASPPSPSPSGTAPPSALGTEPNERIADLAAHLLPLGTGLALMGMGLGYMGVRLRRSR